MNQKKEGHLLDNNAILICLALLGSILTWVMVVYNVDTLIPMTIPNVSVSIDLADSNLARLDLHPVTDGEFTVDVEVLGPRATVGNITKDELIATAKLNNITGPGTYDLALEITDSRNRDVEIKSSLPETISMRFDHQVTKTLPVVFESSGLNIPEGYLLEQEQLYPEEITVVGPATEMAQISTLIVYQQFDNKPISSSFSANLPVIMLDDKQAQVSSPYLQLSDPSVNVTLPVLKKKTVPISFDFTNIPDGFDLNSLVYQISPQTVEVAGPVDLVAGLNELHLGYIDMRTLAPDVNLSYRIKYPNGFVSVEGIEDAEIQFLPETFGEVVLSVPSSNIYLHNLPEEYEATIQTQAINNVMVFGPTKVVEAIQSKDLVAEINMANVDLSIGQITVPVSIVIPNYESCWAYGESYSARITIREKK